VKVSIALIKFNTFVRVHIFIVKRWLCKTWRRVCL